MEGNGRGLAARLLTDTFDSRLLLLMNEGEEQVGYLVVKQALSGPVQEGCSTSTTHLHRTSTGLAIASMLSGSSSASCYHSNTNKVLTTLPLVNIAITYCKSALEQAARVRACNSLKIETGWNLPQVLI